MLKPTDTFHSFYFPSQDSVCSHALPLSCHVTLCAPSLLSGSSYSGIDDGRIQSLLALYIPNLQCLAHTTVLTCHRPSKVRTCGLSGVSGEAPLGRDTLYWSDYLGPYFLIGSHLLWLLQPKTRKPPKTKNVVVLLESNLEGFCREERKHGQIRPQNVFS